MSSSSGSGVRFAPGPFKYNGRVALALVPALLVAAGLGGRAVMGIFTIGTMLWYIMDAMQYREGAFSVGWGTVALAQGGITLNILFTFANRPPLLSILLIFACGALLMVTGMWLTVQFRFVQMQYPAVVLAFERQVLTASLPIAAAMQAIGIAAVAELGDVPYYLAAVLCLLYHMLARPLESSFHQSKAGRAIGGVAAASADATIQSKVDALWLALAVMVLPAASYFAIHAAVLGQMLHFWSLLILGCAPLAYLSAVPDGLWWLPMSPRFMKGLSRLLLVLTSLGLLAGIEGRVIFHAFMPYIKLPAPWNYVAVSGTLLGLVLLGLAHATGALGTSMDATVAGSCLLLCTTAGSLAIGVPFHWLPAPMVAACGLALYYDSRSLQEYSIFVLGAFLTAGWLVHHHFWFLDLRVGFVHLHTICKLALAALLPALIVPGLVLAQTGRQVVGVLMLAQAELLCVLEEQMFGAHHHEEPGSDVMYPAWLVITTSAAGVAACQALHNVWCLPRWAAWVVSTLYIAKLSMLVLPEAYLVMPTALLLLAAGAPVYLYEAEHGKRRVRIKAWQGLLHVVLTLAAVALARFAVFDVVQWAVLGRPHEGVLLGVLLMVAAAALMPLVMTCYAHNQAALRLVILVGVSGLLLAMLQPPLPRMGGAACPQLPFALCPRLWDERHVPMHDADDVAIWGSGLGRREHWPRWLLVLAAGVGLLGMSGAVPGSRSALVRLLVAAAVGWLVGEYLALEVVPGQFILQSLVIGTSMLVVAFITLLQNPLLGSPSWLPLLAGGWACAFIVTMVLQSTLPLPNIQKFRRLYPDSALAIEGERLEANQAALFGVFAAHALLLAFSLKLKMSAALHQPDKLARQPGAAGAASDPYRAYSGASNSNSDFFCGVVPGAMLSSVGRAMQLEGGAGLALRRLSREGLGWVPTAGNVCTLLAFGICVYLNRYMTGGAPEAMLMLAPLLLMLSQDPLLLRQLGERQRYLPPVLAFSCYLTISSAIQVVSWGREYSDWASCALNLALLALALPLHGLFCKYLWDQKPQPAVLLVALGPLCVLSLLLAQAEGIRYLAGGGLVAAALMYFSMRHMKRVGLKVV
ncbi:hypothetical protein OEZ85_006949 [Tetradesmus obliquus]|uniref:NEF1-like protein n=1 Tax=Tetradesmus obliquus TaxID=3088 RepID=A0ABY8TWX9_TETOB|nr:hypothetical protein OEZ85_006949 [Tetradesmus obliquus]